MKRHFLELKRIACDPVRKSDLQNMTYAIECEHPDDIDAVLFSLFSRHKGHYTIVQDQDQLVLLAEYEPTFVEIAQRESCSAVLGHNPDLPIIEEILKLNANVMYVRGFREIMPDPLPDNYMGEITRAALVPIGTFFQHGKPMKFADLTLPTPTEVK